MKITLRKPFVAVLPFAATLMASSANAVVIDFEVLAAPGTGYTPVIDGYIESGFQFLSIHHPGASDSFGAWKSGAGAGYLGSTALFSNYVSPIEMVQVGGFFTLTSIDLACIFGDGATQSITFTGTKTDDTTVTNTFNLTNPNVFQTFTFTGMTGLKKVHWVQNDPYHQFDNIVVTGSPVPEPATLGMLGLGVFALVRRRRA